MLAILIVFASCKKEEPQQVVSTKADIQTEVNEFLNAYTKTFTQLYYDSSKAEWDANTRIVAGDTTNAYKVQQANEAFAKFTGSTENIEKTRLFLGYKDSLEIVQIRQLNTILYAAANNPETVSEVVSKRIAAENAQNETLFGYDFKVGGESVTTGDIDAVLRESSNLNARLANWESSKAVGKELKDGLGNLRN